MRILRVETQKQNTAGMLCRRCQANPRYFCESRLGGGCEVFFGSGSIWNQV